MGMDTMDDLLEQLMKALDFRDPALREKLKRGIEEGLERLDLATADVHFEVDIDGESVNVRSNHPDVTVLDGGLSGEADDEDDASDEGPDLEVLEGEGDDFDHEPEVSVEVLRAPFRTVRRHARGLGRIQVDGQQTLFRGALARPYRLACDEGELRVVVDGAAVETLAEGQTLDVEAALIQVRGTGEGTYRRLT